MYANSSLPKLLAKENIDIRHGNYKTPWFDIKNRVLGLPMWKDMGKDVYDLFVGHEVGHALETPFEGWHDSPEKLKGCPRSYINVIEDARIERKIQSRYPGLVGPFSRGYNTLFNEGFFGEITSTDLDTLMLIDKINLHAKVGSHIDVPFSDEEYVFMDRANKTQTFQEVLDLVRDVLAFTEAQMPEDEDEDEDSSDEQDEQDQDDQDTESDTPQYEEDENGDIQMDLPSGSEEGDTEEDEEETQEEGGGVLSENPIHESITDTNFRDAEKEFLEGEEGDYGIQQTLVCEDISKSMFDKIVIPYATLALDRKARMVEGGMEDRYQRIIEGYNAYVKTTKRSVAIAIKEFEMRKAATQWAKATTAKTGVIDVNKLFSYKTNEDIFKQTTRLHDGKNHGMIMLIDYSGSMYDSLPHVIDQLIHLVLFCKGVNIPFDVYGFTTTNSNVRWEDMRDGDMDLDNLSMPLLTSSSLKKADFEDSLKHLYMRTKSNRYEQTYMISQAEDFGSTPLNQALVASHRLIREFKIKKQIEKMNLVVFSDGDANQVQIYQDSALSDKKLFTAPKYKGITFVIDKRKVQVDRMSDTTARLLENISKRYDTNTIGFFMADENRDWNHKISSISYKTNQSWDELKRSVRKEYNKNKCVIMKNTLGYNSFYLIKGGNALKTEDDEFNVTSNQTKNQMATAFKKFSKSKKQNKVLMTSFGREVA